ncbi:hypothetical protein A0U40_15130 [[Bacillus] sp. KCTC 13219]|nr:hypothetical protein A0U40_15130 [[Bacillus] sp. KCTC 13219]
MQSTVFQMLLLLFIRRVDYKNIGYGCVCFKVENALLIKDLLVDWSEGGRVLLRLLVAKQSLPAGQSVGRLKLPRPAATPP